MRRVGRLTGRHAVFGQSVERFAGYRRVTEKPPLAAEIGVTRHPVPVAARQPAVTAGEPVEKQRRAFFLLAANPA